MRVTVNGLPIAIVFSVNFFIGVIGNFIMIMCFFQNSKLRSPCHILVTILCFCDIIDLGGAKIFAVEIFANITTTQSTCFFMQIGPIIGASAGSPLILAIGIDRLYAVYYPLRYRNVDERKSLYVLTALIFPMSYTVLITTVAFESRLVNDTTLTSCVFPVALAGHAFELFAFSSVVINVLILAVYLAVFILLKTHPASSQFKRVFRSLALTVLFVLLGWVTSTIWNIVNLLLVTDPVLFELFSLYSGIPVQCSLSTNIFVFYAVNPDYRSTIRSLLGLPPSTGPSASNRESGVKIGPSSVV